jgi:acyl carrier protein
VAAWPRTPNGKIDRKALPAPAGDAPTQGDYVAPQSDAERRIADIWKSVLRVERVGVNDNFFDLGGHSLLIVTLQGQLSSAFARDVKVVDLFRFPTVHALARHLTSNVGIAGRLDDIQGRASKSREAALRRRQMRHDVAEPTAGTAVHRGGVGRAAPAPPRE